MTVIKQILNTKGRDLDRARRNRLRGHGVHGGSRFGSLLVIDDGVLVALSLNETMRGRSC
jgi:hypothetical protein